MENYCKNQELKLSDWLQERVGLESFKPGLSRITPLFQPIINGLRDRGVKVITIGGTNGKGEVSFNLERLLGQKKVGLWTSPHVLSIKERFRFNGQQVSYLELQSSFELTEGVIAPFGLSYYEFLFYNFLNLAADCEFLVLEVGLGGRFDAVNLLNPTICALTSIGRDHQEILGRSYRSILFEKLGITRSKIPLVTAFDLHFLQQLTCVHCQKNDIPWTNLSLPRDYTQRNREMAQFIASQLMNEKVVESQKVATKGRFEWIDYRNKRLCFVGAHNLAGMRSLVEITGRNDYDLVMAAFSKRDTKEIQSCIKLLHSLDTEIVLTSFEHPKAAKSSIVAIDWRTLLNDESEQKILITGSYYFIGEVQKYIFDNH